MISERAAVAAFHLALCQLLNCAGFTDESDLADFTVNFDGRSRRIDIARLTEDGMHIAEHLRGYAVDPHDLQAFGTPVGLPGMDGATH